MKRLLFLCALLACRKEAAPPPPPEPPKPVAPARIAEQEPNDFQHAQAIQPRSVVAGSIAAPKDEDWYRLEPGKLQALRVELKQVGEDKLDATLEVTDRDRNKLVAGKDVIPAVACASACFVRVAGFRPAQYELTVLASDPAAGEELEPSDRAPDATALAPGKPMRGTIFSADDEDWYRLSLPQVAPGQFLRVEVTAVPEVRHELEVRAIADGVLLATLRANKAGEALLVRDLSLHLADRPAEVPDAGEADAGEDGGVDASVPAAPAPAGYFLVLKSGLYTKVKLYRGFSPLVPYTLTATVEQGPADLEAEPNDDEQHATPAGATATGWLAPAGDQDWYRIHVDVPSVLHAELSGAAKASPEMLVSGARDPQVIPAMGLPVGDTYLTVKGAGEDRDDPYKLTLTVSPDDGSIEREPNDALAAAQTLALPASVKGWIWPRKDVDLFRFHVGPGHAPVSVILSGPFDLQLRLLELHGDSGEVIGSSHEKLVSVPLKEGDFAVEVSSPRNHDASATQPYTLSIH